MTHIETVSKAIKSAGGQHKVAAACKVSQTAVFRWTRHGLPRTDWTGETNYAEVISGMTKGVTAGGLGKYSRTALMVRG